MQYLQFYFAYYVIDYCFSVIHKMTPLFLAPLKILLYNVNNSNKNNRRKIKLSKFYSSFRGNI